MRATAVVIEAPRGFRQTRLAAVRTHREAPEVRQEQAVSQVQCCQARELCEGAEVRQRHAFFLVPAVLPRSQVQRRQARESREGL